MRKMLLIILVCLLLIFSVFFMVKGVNAFGIHGFLELDEKNDEIENQISELNKDVTVTYTGTESKLERSVNTLIESKTEYENQAILSNSQNSSYVSQKEKYDVEYLWTKLGNYAQDENCTISINVTASGGANENLYNLAFNVGGSYSGVIDFIYDIENDSKLGFEIQNFQISSSGSGVSAKFNCKEIPIAKIQIEHNRTQDDENTGSENTTQNTTQTTNTTSTEEKDGNS